MFATSEAKQSADFILSLPDFGIYCINDEINEDIQNLLKESNIKCILNENCEIRFKNGYHNFFDDLGRIADSNYNPTDEDFIRTHFSTSGIRSTSIKINNSNCIISIIATGGRRCERMKWYNEFSMVHCMVIVVALDHFVQFLYEQNHMNGLHESMNLFSCLVNRNEFRNTPIVLVLSFFDSFEDKIENQGKSLADYFEEYAKYKLINGNHKTDIISGHLRDVLIGKFLPPLVLQLIIVDMKQNKVWNF